MVPGFCPCEKPQLELSQHRALFCICQPAGQSGFSHWPTLCPQSHPCLPCWPQKLPLFFGNFCFSILREAHLVDFGSQKCVLKYDKKYRVSVFQGHSAVPSFLFPLSLSGVSYHSSTLGFLVSLSPSLWGCLSHLSWQVLPVSSTKAAELCCSFIFCLLILPNRFSPCRLDT